MDRIAIRDLSVTTIVGVNPDERVTPQPLVFNVELECDLREACRSDRLEDTVNYKRLQDRIVAEAEGSRYFLIERLAQRVADLCLEDPRVQRVRVALDKPKALHHARAASVEIVRSRDQSAPRPL